MTRRSTNAGCVRTLVTGALAFVVVVVLLLVGWTRTKDFRQGAAGALCAVIAHQTGEQCTLQSLYPTALPLGLVATGLQLTRADGAPIVSVDEVEVRVQLTRAGPRPGAVTLHRPVVTLGFDAQGKLDAFANVAAGDRPMKRLPWERLVVHDANVRLTWPAGAVQVSRLEIDAEQASANITIRAGAWETAGALTANTLVTGPSAVRFERLRLAVPELDLVANGAFTPAGAPQLRVDTEVRGDLDGLTPILWGAARAAEPDFNRLPALHGVVEAEIGVTGSLGDPKVELSALGSGLGVDVAGALVPMVRYRIGELELGAIADRQGAWVQRVRVGFGDGDVFVAGTISREGAIDAHVLGEDVSLATILHDVGAAPTPWVDMRADLDAHVTGAVSPFGLSGPFALAVRELRVGDRPIQDPSASLMLFVPNGTAKGTLEIDRTHLALAETRVQAMRTRGTVDLDLSFIPNGPVSLRASLDHAVLDDLRPLGGAELRGTGTIVGRLYGPPRGLRFDGHGAIDGFSVVGVPWADHLSATIQSPDMRSLVFPVAAAKRGSTDYSGSFLIDCRDPMSLATHIEVPNGRIEDVVGMFVDLEGLTGHLAGVVDLEGPVYDMDGAVTIRTDGLDVYGLKFTGGSGVAYMDTGIFTLDRLQLDRAGDRGGLVARGSVGREYALDLEVLADGLDLATLDWLEATKQPVQGRVSLAGHVGGVLSEPAPEGRISLTGSRYAGRAVDDSTAWFETTDGVMAFSGLLIGETIEVDGTIGLWDDQPYHVDARLLDFPAHALYPVAADGSPVRATASGTVRLDGNFGDDPSPVHLVTSLDDVRIDWAHHALRNTAPWGYEQHGTTFELRNVDLTSGGDAPATAFALAARGDAADLQVTGDGTIDLDLLRAVVPDLQRADGAAAVRLEVARGPDGAAAASVHVDVDASLVRHGSFPGTFEDLSVTVDGTRDGYVLRDGAAGLGGGTVTLAGRIDASDWSPTRFALTAAARDAQIQWIDELPPAIGDAALTFDGPVDALLLSGDVTIDEATFSDRIDWEDWVVEWRDQLLVDAGPLDEAPLFSIDVTIDADRTVRLANNVAEGTASASLRVIGDTARPGLVGEVHVEDGVVYLQDRAFTVDRGDLEFRDPWSWDPELDFDLMTEITSHEQRYRVNYQVHGPFSDWRTTTRSDPQLPQADINALLWFGATAEELEEMGELSQAIAQGVADLVLADLFVSTQVGDIREELPFFVERIEVVTGVNSRGEYSSEPRLLVETRFKDLGDLHLTGELNFVRSDDQYIRLDQRLSDQWSLSGWYATRQRDRQLPIGGAFGLDLRTRWEPK